jgi:integrase
VASNTGITIRHQRGCPKRHTEDCATATSRKASCNCGARDAACNCAPTYQAHVWSVRDKKRIRKTFPTLSAARDWRQDALPALRKETMRAPTQTTLNQSWEAWKAGAEDGTIRTRSGDRYKPSALRGYEQAMRLRILDDLGAVRLSDVSRLALQDIADRLLAEGVDASTIRNTFLPLRAVYRRALSRGDVTVNPTAGLILPAVRGRRDRIASAAEAAALIAALSGEHDRAVWATAFYAGLRLGELQALQDEDVDLAAGVIHVRHSWDKKAGRIDPKSEAGKRKVPIVSALRGHIAAHRLAREIRSEFFFGSNGRPLNRAMLMKRSSRAWAAVELDPFGLHEARHTFASILIAARVNVKAISTYLGHSSIQITLDRYGHLMPGNETEAVGLVDAYLERECATVARQS